jgi:acyl-CoA reductase-like NAD-dependent aldehyde dehydrogenase
MNTTVTNGQAAAVERLPSRLVQQAWGAMPVGQRLRKVRRLRALLVEEASRLCWAVERDIGKSPAETLACELLPLAEACRFLERNAALVLSPRMVDARDRPIWLWGQLDVVHRRPRGIVGIIGTWNYPIFLNGVQIVQALTAGNAVLWKPSEVAPVTADTLWQVITRAGFPEGLLERLPATREAGRRLAESDVDHVVFTGHAETGRALAAGLGRRLISSTLELSGHDAMFVLEDADVRLAARAAWFGATLNRGQTCLAVRRIFVARPIQEEFLRCLESLVREGQPYSLALPAAVDQAERLVRSALADGARIVGGADPCTEGRSCRPIILADVRPDMAVFREASFAPIAAVMAFDRLEDALEVEAGCEYALGASIFSRDPAKARGLAARLRAGLVTINDVIAASAHPAVPFGGQKSSGWGVTHGAEGLFEMTIPQVVSVRSGAWRPHYDPPNSSLFTSHSMLQAMLRWQHAATFKERLSGLWQVVARAIGKTRKNT